MQSKNAHFMQLAGAEPCGRISSALAAAHDNGVMLRSLPLLIHGVSNTYLYQDCATPGFKISLPCTNIILVFIYYSFTLRPNKSFNTWFQTRS